MANSITGIPTTRVSESYVRDRLQSQLQTNQAALFNLQMQLSTGRRFQTPSEDPIAALRVMSLQRLLERKAQINTNITTNQSYMKASDTALSGVSGLIAEARGTAISVLGTTSSDVQRNTAAQQIDQAIQQIMDTANQQFRGRYLFAGSETQLQPFQAMGEGYVEYSGNELSLQSYADVNLLFDTNLNGNEVFGAISNQVEGTDKLGPVLTYNTRLADLREGEGISSGSILVSDGTDYKTIDLSGCETISDLAARIHENPPGNRQLYVDITANKLTVQLDKPGGGSLTIREVGGGRVADELGIRRENGVGTNPIYGRDLSPVLRKTTPLSNILGAYANTVVHSAGPDNDIRLVAKEMGENTSGGIGLNDIKVSFVHDPTIIAGNEQVVFDPTGKTLTVAFNQSSSRAFQVVEALNRADIPFTAEIDPLENLNNGLGMLTDQATGYTRDGGGEPLDQHSGLRIVNQGKEYSISFLSSSTLEDVMNTINGAGAGVRAEINESKNGINLRSMMSGCDFMIGENGGTTASQLGLRTFSDETELSGMNFGRGISKAVDATARAAEAEFLSGAKNSNLVFRARQTGPLGNDYQVTLNNSGGPPAVYYDAVAKTIRVDITPGVTTALDVKHMLEMSPAAADFEVFLEGNPDGSSSDGSGAVDVSAKKTMGGTEGGIDFTITRTDGKILYVDVSQARTIGDVLKVIKGNSANADGLLDVRLAKYGNGIELVDGSGGTGSLKMTRDPTSQAAIDLGLIPEGKNESILGSPNHATTLVSTGVQNNIIVRGKDPSTPVGGIEVVLDSTATGVNFSETTGKLIVGIIPGTTTAADVVQAINESPAGAVFVASLDPADRAANTGLGAVAAGGPFTMTVDDGTNYSRTTTTFPGYNRNLVISGLVHDATFDNMAITFNPVVGGPISFAADFGLHTMVINYDSTVGSVSTANQIVSALNTDAVWGGVLHATLDAGNGNPNDGSGMVAETKGTMTEMTTGPKVISGRDVNKAETDGVFTALLRLRDALRGNDAIESQRAIELLDGATTKLNFSRSELGAREQGLEVSLDRLSTEDIELQGVLSTEYDADIVKVISDLSARQAAYEASMRSTAKIMQMTLLNYL